MQKIRRQKADLAHPYSRKAELIRRALEAKRRAATILITGVALGSCGEGSIIAAEREYAIKQWEHQARILELEYIEKLSDTRKRVNMNEAAFLLDSLESVQNGNN